MPHSQTVFYSIIFALSSRGDQKTRPRSGAFGKRFGSVALGGLEHGHVGGLGALAVLAGLDVEAYGIALV